MAKEVPEALILCGGLGTRLRSVVSDRPKPMAEVKGRPFIELLIEQLCSQGVKRIILCAGYLGEYVSTYFSNHHFDAEIDVVIEPLPLGTAGAVKHALPYLNDDVFLVINGDSFCHYQLQELVARHLEAQASATIYATRVEDATRFGTLELSDNQMVNTFKEKGSAASGWVNAGAYVLNRALFDTLDSMVPASLELDVFPNIAGRTLAAYLGDESFIDIGTPDDYHRFKQN